MNSAPTAFSKNDAGGTLGGISSGQDILASIALKPTSSISVPGKTIDKSGKETEIVTKGRHDPCVWLAGHADRRGDGGARNLWITICAIARRMPTSNR